MSRFINADAFTSTGQGVLGNNMFAYCACNPICYIDSSGYFFFTALGALTGFVAGVVTATINNCFVPDDEKVDVLSAGIDGAIGGAISGAGVDASLLLIGSCGTALPVVATGYGIAFMAGGLGNVYTTYASSDGRATDEEMSVSFIMGGLFNAISLGTSMSCVSDSIEGLLHLGNAGLNSNFALGTGIAIGTSVATGLGTEIHSAIFS